MFFWRKVEAQELLNGLNDCHTHILPGVDDGVRTLDNALELLSFYEQQGVESIVFTPHIMEQLPENTAPNLQEHFAMFTERYSGSIKLSLGAEYMLDSTFLEHLHSGELLPIFDNYLLVEMSSVAAAVNLFHVISQIMNCGYFVVLAHPERYLYLGKSDYLRLKNMGVWFQLNLPSILGSYGSEVKSRAEQLLNNDMYNVVGSDIHSLSYHKKQFSTTKISKKLFAKIKAIQRSYSI